MTRPSVAYGPIQQVSDLRMDPSAAHVAVLEPAADPWGWRSEIEAWANRHGEKRVLEWNTAHAQHMAPATDRLYQAVATKTVTHDGDPRLAAHMAHCVAKRTPMGDLAAKDKRNSPAGSTPRWPPSWRSTGRHSTMHDRHESAP